MTDQLALHDLAPSRKQFLEDALAGLTGEPKTLPCKYFYDEHGSKLFDEICRLEEYYPTRTELAIMRNHGAAMGDALGKGCLVVEYGSGSSTKTRLLLDALEEPAGYVPVDISREHLVASSSALSKDHPDIPVLPVCADFTDSFELPAPPKPARRTVVYFPGSTIGNFAADEAQEVLGEVATQVGSNGGLLIGVDLVKDSAVLERAYDDEAGVTARFNKNLLRRLNRELGADFDPATFDHDARWNAEQSRIEMHLVARQAQTVRLDGASIELSAGESIHTENSHKYSLDGFAALASSAGLEVEQVWTDERKWFSVQSLRVG